LTVAGYNRRLLPKRSSGFPLAFVTKR